MKKIYCLLIVAVLLAVSCEKGVAESPTIETEPEQEIVYPEIQVALSVDTKTTITDKGSTFSFAFQKDDDIAVFNGEKDEDTHLPCRYRCTRIEDGVAYFSYYPTTDAESAIRPDPELATIVATHPYRGTTTSGYETYGSGTLKVRMANSLSSSSSGYVKASVPIVAAAAAGDVLQFKHTIGLMQLKLKGTDINIKQIVVVSDKQIVGDSEVEYGDSEPVLEVKGTDGNGSISDFYKATYKYNDATGLALSSEGMDFYIALPEGSHNLSLTITDAKGNSMLLSAPSVPISRGVVIPTELDYVADPLSNVTNLSAFGHFANCYVVTDAGNYCFNARKPDGTLVSGESATWVWASGEAFASTKTETQFNAKMVSDISLNNGKVYFSVPNSFMVGNAVLGITDNSNNILYSWHIWLTSSDIDTQEVAGVTAMDRDLGAGGKVDVSATENGPWQRSRGTYYQWGRKDPILGSRNNTTEKASPGASDKEAFNQGNSQYHIENTLLTNVTIWGYGIDFGGLSADDGAKYPISMAKIGCVPGHIADDFSTLWSDRTNANPCPYGYRVMNKDEMDRILALGTPSVSYYGSFHAINAGGLLFPGAGMRYGSDGTFRNNADVKYYLDNQISTTNAKAKAYRFQWNNSTHAYSTGSYSEFDTYHAGSVRCVKE